MLEDGAVVHVFTRASTKAPFTYAGLGRTVQVSGDKPVYITWEFAAAGPPPAALVTKRRKAWGTRVFEEHSGASFSRQAGNEVLLQRDPAKLERALDSHRAIEAAVASILQESGHQALRPNGGPEFDLCWDANGVRNLVEAKSLTDLNVTAQMRTGIGQLAGYRARLEAAGQRVGRCLLAVESQPRDPTWTTACRSCGIELIWGPDFDGLLGV